MIKTQTSWCFGLGGLFVFLNLHEVVCSGKCCNIRNRPQVLCKSECSRVFFFPLKLVENMFSCTLLKIKLHIFAVDLQRVLLSRVSQWLALLPQSKRVQGSNLCRFYLGFLLPWHAGFNVAYFGPGCSCKTHSQSQGLHFLVK